MIGDAGDGSAGGGGPTRPATGVDARLHERYPNTLTVQIERARRGERIYGMLYELSLGGAFIQLDGGAPGEMLTVQVTALGRTVVFVAEVRYVAAEGGDGPRGLGGVGVAWRRVDAGQRLFLEEIIARVQAGLPLRPAG